MGVMRKFSTLLGALLVSSLISTSSVLAAPTLQPPQPVPPVAQPAPRCHLGCGFIYGAWKWSAMGCPDGTRCETSVGAVCPSPNGAPFVIEGTCKVGDYTDFKPRPEPPPTGQRCDAIMAAYAARSGGKMPPNSWIKKIRRKECLREDKAKDFVFPEDRGCTRSVIPSELKPVTRDSPVCCFNQCPTDSWQFLDPVALPKAPAK